MARSISPDIPVATHDGMQTLLDSPRVRLGEGAHPWTVLAMRHAGSDHDTLSARIALPPAKFQSTVIELLNRA